ncbi:hypothetical protein [Aliihoeflea sp. 40Bstr573]|uniref:hypothetical protein n=1 Tax=Aliihoeflea sp. 40Bstr573 TaxID=2696467 RepID=UPI0020961F77|nr:hypothetical protein [Aliihoeflea sp. 40Bstr573]MCO6387198.1 hypothetical protein [Aliihoeflea sp. 40Bstr573]
MAGSGQDLSGRSFISQTSAGILRVTLLFGSAVIALTLILVPIADKNARDRMFASVESPGIDRMSTGSIGPRSSAETYTIRRSVLQQSPSAVCIIRESGARSGSC